MSYSKVTIGERRKGLNVYGIERSKALRAKGQIQILIKLVSAPASGRGVIRKYFRLACLSEFEKSTFIQQVLKLLVNLVH